LLSGLKSLLPAHSAYAVARTLEDWSRWAGDSDSKEAGAGASREAGRADVDLLATQGRIWRQLLTGEKSATDFLVVGDYVTAAQQVCGRVARAAKGLWLIIAGAVVLTAGAAALIWLIKGIGSNIKLITYALWLAGVLGISVKGAGSLIGAALKDAEGWLWQAELDESVAAAVAHLPDNFTHERLTKGEVGRLPVIPESPFAVESGDDEDPPRPQALASQGVPEEA
jgi:hypothetical protein